MPSTPMLYKKVLLLERKRHTARHVVSTPSVVLTGVPPILTWLGGGVPCQGGTVPGYPPVLAQGDTLLGVPYLGTPHPGPGEYPARGIPCWGYPTWVPPILTWQGTPPLGMPMAFWVMLQSIMGYGYPLVSAPWHSGKCCKALWDMGTPLWTDRRTDTCQNITFPSYYVRGR